MNNIFLDMYLIMFSAIYFTENCNTTRDREKKNLSRVKISATKHNKTGVPK